MPQHSNLKVRLASALSRHTGNQKEIVCPLKEKDTIETVLNHLDTLYPGIKKMVCANGVDIDDGINIYVNGDNVRYLEGMKTLLKDEDTVNIIPAAAAG
jgi:sulfur-carrier protein